MRFYAVFQEHTIKVRGGQGLVIRESPCYAVDSGLEPLRMANNGLSMKWVRAKDGMIFGVCKGMARALEIPVGLMRVLWLCSLLFLGVGLGLYLLLAICLPREDKTVEALDPWILGVCTKISQRTDVEVGVVRFICVCLSLLSLGSTVVGYIVLYFVLDSPDAAQRSSESKPSIPPETT
ncbi:MAG: PspC domain-containing protein [Calothrix sp. SM1_5_4]|nr:PspC domain-containing protein [Calothrix sp. SM1_5_4]